ncbi:extracellular solute-binding protein [Streptosporangiaceae bacterium NEAU-GS5]|nr:extracellular solute-binding protein [Streptosporangiaceae bacterium NEAU-GS5]
MRRVISAVASAAALALAVTACGGGTSSESAAPAKSVAPAEVSGEITWWDTSDATKEGPAFQDLIKDFQAKYPKIKVNYVNVPFGEAQNKYKTAAQSGSGAPDVLRTEVGWVAEFASLGYLQPLDGTPAVDKADDFLPGPASAGKYNGKTYAVPQVTDTLGLLYNKQLLSKAGVEVPKTFDELKQAALTIKQKTGVDGLALNVDSYFLLPFIYGEGGDLLNVDTKKITVASPESVKGVAVVEDLIKSGAVGKPAVSDSYVTAETAFKEGKAAMIFNGPWANTDNLAGKVFKDDPDNFGVAPVPAGSVKAAAPTGGHTYSIYAGSKNIPASELFVQFMASADSQAKIAGSLGLLPTRTSAYDMPAATANPMVGVWKTVMDTAVSRPWIPEQGQLFAPLLEGYQNIVTGKADSKAAMDAVAKKYSELLKGWSL